MAEWYGKYNNDESKAVFKVLEKYFLALQNNTAHEIFPDPFYKWKVKVPDVEALIKGIENDIFEELKLRSPTTWLDCEPSDLGRLLNINNGAPALALAQELDQVLLV